MLSLQIADGWLMGTPCVTTRIGSEGMMSSSHSDDKWGGAIAATNTDFITQAVNLYTSPSQFNNAQAAGLSLLQQLFDRQQHSATLCAILNRMLSNVAAYRDSDVIGQLLWHQQLRSTEYFSKYVATKQELSTLKQQQQQQLAAKQS